jgi:hypothetical protein
MVVLFVRVFSARLMIFVVIWMLTDVEGKTTFIAKGDTNSRGVFAENTGRWKINCRVNIVRMRTGIVFPSILIVVIFVL